MKSCLKIITAIVCWLAVTAASAQKLPAVQQVSLFAPNHKAGKLLDALDHKFQAYNNGDHVYYTMANDDNNLYLSAYTTDKLTIQKIVRWGLALTVDRGKKVGPGSPSVSFPIPDGDKNLSIIRKIESEVPSKALYEVPSKALYNAKMAKICKLIAVKNLAGVDGPTISIYNSQGIKAMALFNDKLEYTYELTIPLKYLNISAKDKARFYYDIKLNGANSISANRDHPGPVRKDGARNPNIDYLDSPTDFSGICMPASK